MGDVNSMFIAEKSRVDAAMGKDVYFGEILGKHSEVHGTLTENDLTIKSEDQEFIAKFEEVMGEGFETGHNPITRIEEAEEGY